MLKTGGMACINIGDATRKINAQFGLYASHARIVEGFGRLGLTTLPAILWRKPTNAPTKFMGSGMYPPGAYVTLEHELILIFRKGPLRPFRGKKEVLNRRESAYFWEERNIWFSDVWLNLPGSGQALDLDRSRDRSAAFPFEIPYRLINMFSVKGDTILDPFAGTGTTMAAAVTTGRNSIGIEVDPGLNRLIKRSVCEAVQSNGRLIENRLHCHLAFVRQKLASGYDFKYENRHYEFPVMTRQETDLLIDIPDSSRQENEEQISVTYSDDPVRAMQDVIHYKGSAISSEQAENGMQKSPSKYQSRQRNLWEKS